VPGRGPLAAASSVLAVLLLASTARADPAASASGGSLFELEPLVPRLEFPAPPSAPFDVSLQPRLTAQPTVPGLRLTTPQLALAVPTLSLASMPPSVALASANAVQPSSFLPVRVVDFSRLPARDYNEADPHRGLSNHLRAVAGLFAINWVIWQYDWLSSQREIFFVTRETIVRNFKTGFVFDDNSFQTNFFGHPFHGSMYMGSARGAGLSYWEALPYPWLGSFLWEFTGERHLPAPNDWIATSWGGTVIGEAMFRLANEVFDDSLSGAPRLWSELGGTAVSPLYGLQRLTSGRTVADGPPPHHRRLDAELMVGLNRVRLNAMGNEQKYDPGLFFAIDVEYGDLLPKPGENHVDPFEFFDLFAALSLSGGELGGSQLFIEAPVYGWNTYLSDPKGAHPDNNVFAITQFFDYQGANIVQFGGAGLGVGNYTVWRFNNDLRFRISANLQGAFLSGATSPFTAATGRTYNFAAGGTADVVSRLDSKTFGELGFRARQYLTWVIDGADGSEFTGYMRPWYQLPTFHHLSLGAAATLINRRGAYDDFGTVHGYSLSTELYALYEL